MSTPDSTPERSDELPELPEGLGLGITGMLQLLERLNEPEQRRQWYEDAISDEQYPADLRNAFAAYSSEDERFEPGELVQWKPMLKNREYPADGAPGIVVRYLPEPLRPDTASQSEDLDIEIGYLTGDQAFVVFAYSSARFTRWVE